MKKKVIKKITAKEFDALFDSGSDEIDNYIDWSKAKLKAPQIKRVNVDFPEWVVRRLDMEAKHRGITRQALIKLWIFNKLKPAAA